ncbi:hypothetical protein KW797_04365 [Candidatus Parcubacteria bacterium]|nr:hypothetical protein [Candidatus Parcubacteria bacterium]
MAKITLEFKKNRYTLTYGGLTGSGATVKEALEDLVLKFKEAVSKFFIPQ